MSRVIYRYRRAKPSDGHLMFKLHAEAEVLFWTEHWHGESGWEVILDALVDTEAPLEDRRFFLCNAGDRLDALGEMPGIYQVGTAHEAKAYASYLFETTHLADQERVQLRVSPSRMVRARPERSDLSMTERIRIDKAKAGNGSRKPQDASWSVAAVRLDSAAPDPPAPPRSPQEAPGERDLSRGGETE